MSCHTLNVGWTWSSSTNLIWWWSEKASRMLIWEYTVVDSTSASMWRKGVAIFGAWFVKINEVYMHVLFPSWLFDHVLISLIRHIISWLKPIERSFCTSCFMATSLSSLNLLGFCWIVVNFGSMFNWCITTSFPNPSMSLVFHAKVTLLFPKNYTIYSCSNYSISNPTIIFCLG